MSTKKTSQQIGQEFEVRFSKSIGAEKVKASGALWHSKMDAIGQEFIFSLKSTTKNSFNFTRELFMEVKRAAFGPGGVNSGKIPVMCINIVDKDYIVIELEDFKKIMTEEINFKILETQKNTKKRQGKIPALLRKSEDNY